MWPERRASQLEQAHRLEVPAEEGIHARAVDDGLLAVEVDELLEREGIADEVGGGVLEALLLFGCDRLADGEAGMPPGEQLRHDLWRDGVGLEASRQETLREEAHEPPAVPFRQRQPGAVRRLAAVGGEQVEERMPLKQITGGGDGDDDAGAGVSAEAAAGGRGRA